MDEVFGTHTRLRFPAHRARLEEFHARGVLLGAGPLGDPRDRSSMGLFTTREATEEFVKDDPFVANVVGHVTGHVVEPVLSRVFDYWRSVDKAVGDAVE